MVSSSKILTVSYGTFSCTAEGFEDPLAVVKETTHFFRGVVGEDRFFGAEPPQFDADLAAEMMRERLTPEMGEGKLSLGPALGAGAASAGALAAALTAGQARGSAAPMGADSLPDDDTIEATAVLTEREDIAADSGPDLPETLAEPAPAAEAEPVVALDAAPEPEQDFDLGSIIDTPAPAAAPSDVAAKLDRIRAVVAGNAATAADENDDTTPLADLAPDEDGEQVDDDALAALLGDYDDDASVTDTALEDLVAAETAETTDDNLFADTLAGLMAGQELDAEEDASEIEAVTEVEAQDDEDLVAEDADDFDDEMLDDDDNDSDDDLAEADDTPRAAGDAFAAWDDDAEDDYLEEDDAPEAELDDTLEEDDIDLDQGDELLAEDVAEAEPEPIRTPPPPPAKPAIRARVVKVKRTVFEEAVKSGQLEEIEDEIAGVPGESSLSPEEEDELARELAAVKAELNGGWDDDTEEDDFLDEDDTAEAAPVSTRWEDEGDDDYAHDDEDEDDTPAAPAPLRLEHPVKAPTRSWDDDLDALDARAEAAFGPSDDDDDDDSIEAMVRDSARKAVKMASPARAMLTESSVEDNDTSRILDETNKELDEPEGSRRRTAIAHLRAAVAATRADKLLGRKADVEQEAKPYREDLADVVRPRRPQPVPSTRSERPADPARRPAPLKLVAEQRVEENAAPAPRQVTPVRPRRIRRDAAAAPRNDAAEAVDSGFADYAASVGAVNLPELLEAAAAYMSYVEGREQFSRPQLMTTVRQAEQQESSREDRLRSFGQLLREGKIEKTSGGRFTASERISFKPDRAAG